MQSSFSGKGGRREMPGSFAVCGLDESTESLHTSAVVVADCSDCSKMEFSLQWHQLAAAAADAESRAAEFAEAMAVWQQEEDRKARKWAAYLLSLQEFRRLCIVPASRMMRSCVRFFFFTDRIESRARGPPKYQSEPTRLLGSDWCCSS